MSFAWSDASFAATMKELEPASRAQFLSMTYKAYPESFPLHSPDIILVQEFGIDKYLELLGSLNGVLPIVAIPSKELTA